MKIKDKVFVPIWVGFAAISTEHILWRIYDYFTAIILRKYQNALSL